MEGSFYDMLVELSRKERYEMYMGHTKEELAGMLAERDIVDAKAPVSGTFPVNRRNMICKSWKDCTNVNRDCIDCPLRYKSGDRSYASYEFHIPETPSEGVWY